MKKRIPFLFAALAVLVGVAYFSAAVLPTVTLAASAEKNTSTLTAPVLSTEEPERQSVSSLAQNATEAQRFPDPHETDPHPAEISGVIGASLSASLYGAVPHVTQSVGAVTLSNLVLQGKVDAAELGVFDIRYTLTAEEYDMLLFCVDHETRNGSLEHKSLIAQVVMNRVQGQRFPFTVRDVLMAPNQFDVMPWYENRSPDWVPSQVTQDAVAWVLSGTSPDFAQGAVYFCNPYIVGEGNWFDTSLTAICEIQGHRFYKP